MVILVSFWILLKSDPSAIITLISFSVRIHWDGPEIHNILRSFTSISISLYSIFFSSIHHSFISHAILKVQIHNSISHYRIKFNSSRPLIWFQDPFVHPHRIFFRNIQRIQSISICQIPSINPNKIFFFYNCFISSAGSIITKGEVLNHS